MGASCDNCLEGSDDRRKRARRNAACIEFAPMYLGLTLADLRKFDQSVEMIRHDDKGV